MAMRLRTLLIAVLMLVACDGKGRTTGIEAPSFSYPLDDVLRINDLQMKGTHNSYHQRPSADPIDEWNYSHAPLSVQVAEQGVRQFELDVHYRADEKRFHVYHLPGADDQSSCPLFVDCLGELKTWSDANPGHHPLFVFIEPKDDADRVVDAISGHLGDLEAEILSVWPRRRIITPDDVKGAHATLREAVQAGDWPTLGEARGKAVFVLLEDDHETGSLHAEYTNGNTSLDGKLMFATALESDPYGAILSINSPHDTRIEAAARQGFIVRTMPGDPFVDGAFTSRADLEAGLDGYAHILSNDDPVPGRADDYWLDLKGGNPTRCHKLAPSVCTAAAIEDLD